MSEVDERIREGFPRGGWGIAGTVSSVEERHEVPFRRKSHPPLLPRIYLTESVYQVVFQWEILAQICQLVLLCY